jgi:hypothetical protein
MLHHDDGCDAGSRRSPRPRRSLAALAALVVLGASLAGCVAQSSLGVTADQIEIEATFIDQESSIDGKQPVTVQFFENGKLVQLRNGATIRCNGVELATIALGFGGRVPQEPSGGSYKITHELDGEIATFAIPVPARPTISSPASGAQLPRSAAQMVTFPAVSGSMIRLNASGTAGTSNGTWIADSGSATVDVTALGAGTGTLSLMRQMEGAVANTGFAKARFTYAIEKSLTVVWL